MTAPYYTDDAVTLWHGDMREVILALQLTADCIVADPPYGETSLAWDRWPDGWPAVAALASRSMWCFGSMRMFLDQRDEFAVWKLSQDVVWEKHNGSGFASDRFRRVHEHALHWYRGKWRSVHRDVPRLPSTSSRHTQKGDIRIRADIAHAGAIGRIPYVDDGLRLARSVLREKSAHGAAVHPTQKPVGILAPLIEYACPPGGLILDPFAGSGSTAVVARLIGRRAVLIEADEWYCEVIAKRLAQDVLPIGGVS